MLRRWHVALALVVVALITVPVVLLTSGPAGMSDDQRTTWISLAGLGFAVVVIALIIASRRNKKR